MKISSQTLYLSRVFGEEKCIEMLKRAGFDCIDFSFTNDIDLLLDEKAYCQKIIKIKEHADSIGISFNQAHAPYPSSVGEKQKDDKIFNAIVNSIKYASMLNIKAIIVHPKKHLEYKSNKEILKDMNVEFYKSLIPYCEKYNVKVALENMWQLDKESQNIVHSTCASPKEFVEYLDKINSPWIVGCLDVGHAFLVDENPAQFIKTIGKEKLACLHIHDVCKNADRHILPGLESVDFNEIVKALKEIDYQGEFTLEADTFIFRFGKDYDIDFLQSVVNFMAERARYLANL